MASLWTKNLNPEQVKAVLHDNGPLLILAGAGSGKTTVLVSRTGRLIEEQKARSHEICVLTFTNKAAQELQHRVQQKVGSQSRGLWAGTFHSFGLQILRRFHKAAQLSPQFGIVDQSDCQAIIKELLKERKHSDKDSFAADRLLNAIQNFRLQRLFPDIFRSQSRVAAIKEDPAYLEMAEMLTASFMKRLELLGVVDFEGLLLKPLQLFCEHNDILQKVQNQFKQIMVDEFQDTNILQMQLIHKMSEVHNNLTVVGDDDQSIYGWRGAEIQNILNFPKNYKNCEVIKLERNYRSSSEILHLANAAISKNQKRHGKVLRSEQAQQTGEKPEVFVLENEDEESDFVALEINHWLRQGFRYQDIAVLYRSNTQGGMIESALRRSQIPYTITGGNSIFDRPEIKDIMAYLKQSLTSNEVSLRRVINTPPRGVGEATLDKMARWAEEHKMTFFEAFELWDESLQKQLPQKALDALADLRQFLNNLPGRLLDFPVGSTPGQNLLVILTELGYRNHIYNLSKDSKIGEKRWQLVEIFGRILDGYLLKRGYEIEYLKSFLDAMSLRDDLREDDDINKVQLMTLHASKGLEFPVVILAGLEEDLLPHKRLGSDIDEERRLFYVGVTRAKHKLILTRCRSRKKQGVIRSATPSRFLLEVPVDLYREYPLGARPLAETSRQQLVADFLAGLKV